MSNNHAPDIDSLTGLFNGRYAMDALRRAIDSREVSKESSVAVIFADVLRFKNICETFGHMPADEVLQAVTQSVRATAHDGEIACRYAADNFLIILPHATEAESRQRAENLRESVENTPLTLDGRYLVHLTLSIGLAHRLTLYRVNPRSKLHGAEALMRDAEADLLRDRERSIQRATLLNPAN